MAGAPTPRSQKEGLFFKDNDNELFPGHIYSVDVETTNADVPYGDTFFVLSHYCLVKVVFVYTYFVYVIFYIYS